VGTSGMGTWIRLAGVPGRRHRLIAGASSHGAWPWATSSFSIRKTSHMPISAYIGTVARASTTSDAFNAVADMHQREILDALITGEKAVGAIVNDLSMSQPHVYKDLRVLSAVGLVKCRAEGRHRLYRLEPANVRPLHDWVAKV